MIRGRNLNVTVRIAGRPGLVRSRAEQVMIRGRADSEFLSCATASERIQGRKDSLRGESNIDADEGTTTSDPNAPRLGARSAAGGRRHPCPRTRLRHRPPRPAVRRIVGGSRHTARRGVGTIGDTSPNVRRDTERASGRKGSFCGAAACLVPELVKPLTPFFCWRLRRPGPKFNPSPNGPRQLSATRAPLWSRPRRKLRHVETASFQAINFGSPISPRKPSRRHRIFRPAATAKRCSKKSAKQTSRPTWMNGPTRADRSRRPGATTIHESSRRPDDGQSRCRPRRSLSITPSRGRSRNQKGDRTKAAR